MKKFIKGAFELDKNVTDLVAYEKPIEGKLKKICDWGDQFKISIQFGTTEDNTYLCEYRVIANTKTLCNGLIRELKELLHEAFPTVKTLWQMSGNYLY
jgi:hypothetical protein